MNRYRKPKTNSALDSVNNPWRREDVAYDNIFAFGCHALSGP